MSSVVQQQIEAVLVGPAPARGAEQIQGVDAVAVTAPGQQEGARGDQSQQLVLVTVEGEVPVEVPGVGPVGVGESQAGLVRGGEFDAGVQGREVQSELAAQGVTEGGRPGSRR